MLGTSGFPFSAFTSLAHALLKYLTIQFVLFNYSPVSSGKLPYNVYRPIRWTSYNVLLAMFFVRVGFFHYRYIL